ncbi:MAG: VCBS repeat-containing protein [Planctomycetaceae bacterium]|nr:VCBS repeat-containing protein [Planctomycetaceae bacterium]
MFRQLTDWVRDFLPRARRRGLSRQANGRHRTAESLEVRTLLSGTTPASPEALVLYDDHLQVWIAADSDGTQFVNEKVLGTWQRSRDWTFLQGDFNGDHRPDVLGRAADGQWQLVLNLAIGIQTQTGAEIGLTADLDWNQLVVGDFDGNGRDDVAGLNATGEWSYAASTPSGFQVVYMRRISANGYISHLVADFDNDGQDDIANLHSNGHWWVTESEGSEFRNVYYGPVSPYTAGGWMNFQVGDFTGDGFTDTLLQDAIGRWWIGRNTQHGRFTTYGANRWGTTGYEEFRVGDFNGDGRDDLAGRTVSNAWFVNVSQPDGGMLLDNRWAKWGRDYDVASAQGDFNGDGIEDIVGWFPESGGFWAQLGTANHSDQARFGNFHAILQPIEDVAGLPRVLLIGDSISIGYTMAVRDAFIGEANVHRILTNGGPTDKGLEQLAGWLGSESWDVIHFNFGLHDLKYLDANDQLVDPSVGTQVNSPEEYRQNLELIVQQLQATGAKLVWANTTPIQPGSLGRKVEDVALYNNVAKQVMDAHSIPINDLYYYAITNLGSYQKPADVHFTLAGSDLLAQVVSNGIRLLLN